MRGTAFVRGVVAVALIAVSPAWLMPVPAGSATATLSGTVVAADAGQPLVGAKVYVADPKTGQVFASQPTGPDGGFAVDALPAAAYELGVEARGGLFLVPSPVALAPGQAQNIHLAVDENQAATETTGPPGSAKGRPSIWSNPVTAALIVLGAALVVGVLIQNATDDNDSASASLP